MIFANGFFVLGEFSLVAVDRSKIEELAERGVRRADGVLRALTSLSFQLSGAQLGITVTSLVLGFIVESTVAEALRPLFVAMGLPPATVHAVSLTVALALATATQMVLGELAPKNLAIARPVAAALWAAAPMRAVNTLLKPLILLLNNSANSAVRLLGIEPQEELTAVRSLEEWQFLIESSREQGALPEEHASLLARSISFGDKTAADALIPRTSLTALRASQTLEDLRRVALESGHSRFPVFGRDLDDIVGVAHVKDSYGVPSEHHDRAPVSEIARDAIVVPESCKLDSLLYKMRRERRQIAIVLDEYGGTAGIVTLEDLIEEIVGDIEDEYDPFGRRTAEPPGGIHVVSGMLHPDEVAEQVGFEMPEGDYETLAGFLLSLLDRIPEPGDHVAYDGWELKVIEMDRNRIARVLIVAPPPKDDASENEGGT